MWLRFGDTLQSDFLPGSCWQDHIGHPYLRQFIYYFSGFITQSIQFAELGQAFPQDIGQKANQDMGLHPIRSLMPHRSEFEVTFMDPKGSLSFGQLHIRLPQIGR